MCDHKLNGTSVACEKSATTGAIPKQRVAMDLMQL